jgi:hypothetical protein
VKQKEKSKKGSKENVKIVTKVADVEEGTHTTLRCASQLSEEVLLHALCYGIRCTYHLSGIRYPPSPSPY